MPRKHPGVPGKKPNYDLKALHKETEKTSYVGAGWLQPDGSIAIYLDLCVTIAHNPNLVLTLFPRKDGPEEKPDAVPDLQ